MKRILMFKTSMCCEDSVVGGLVQLGFHVDVLTGSVRDYERDSEIQKGFYLISNSAMLMESRVMQCFQ